MDILRQALGDKQLNYMGKSYGTYLGTLYAQFFPEKVGRVVLDGAVDPTISNFQQTLTQAVGFDQAFSSFAKDCASRKNCTLPKGKVAAIAEMQKLFAQAAKKPLPTKSSKRTLSETMIVLGTASAMYDSATGWPKLRKAITQSQSGFGDEFLELADEYTGRQSDGSYPNNEFDSGAVIDCLDVDEPRTVAQIKRDAKSFEEQAPLFGPYLAYGGLACKYFSQPQEVIISPIKTTNPIIVIGTTGDPATPYEWAQGLSKLLTNSVLVSLTGEGHTGQGQGNACIDDQVDDYYIYNLPPMNLICEDTK
jgi:pimeloyl-ACP methyl ester carboxylesterase